MKQQINPAVAIIVIVVIAALVAFFYIKKGGGSEAAPDQAATLKEIKPRENSPSVPPGGAIPGVAGPAGLK